MHNKFVSLIIAAIVSFNIVTVAQELVHSRIGDESKGVPGSLKITNIGKLQHFTSADKDTYDTDINSPKSVNVSPDAKTLYVNSLEGYKTIAYSIPDLKKKFVVSHEFPSGMGELWAPPSGYYNFTHYPGGENRAFKGKPVEAALSHSGKYLWVPYYRRDFDLNAQDPSAMAVINTAEGKIVRMFETGPIPKVVAVSPDGTGVAITHWGDNTVGFIDISSKDPAKWHHLPPITVGKKLQLNYSLTSPVNRDSGSGNLLRGTVFTPDSKYMFVAALAGPLAIFDVKNHKLIGTSHDLYGLRHIVIHDGMVYGSINTAGMAVSVPLQAIIDGINDAVASGSDKINIKGEIKKTHVGGGARTIKVSPDGKYLFVACNFASAVYVLDTKTMEVVDTIRCDSFPVGLALTPDGKYLAVTSQGRKDIGGGNAVNLFKIDRPDMAEIILPPMDDTASDSSAASGSDKEEVNIEANHAPNLKPLIIAISAAIIAAIAAFIAIKGRRKK